MTATNLTTALKTARALCNKQTFGTPEYDEAFEAVRRLTSAINAAAPAFAHTSIDGDIFDRRAARH